MRSVGCTERVGDVLVLVTQVGEKKALVSDKIFHFVVAIFRKLYRVIWINCDECNALWGIVLVKRFETIENQFYVRTMIAHDDHAHRLMGFEVPGQMMNLAVCAR